MKKKCLYCNKEFETSYTYKNCCTNICSRYNWRNNNIDKYRTNQVKYNNESRERTYKQLGEEEYNKHLKRIDKRKHPELYIKRKPNLNSPYYKYNLTYRNNFMLKKYSISLIEYQDILLSQNNLCCICNKQLKEDRNTHIDHNHNTNKVRGILCYNCNILLGHAKDNITILQNAIKYLESK